VVATAPVNTDEQQDTPRRSYFDVASAAAASEPVVAAPAPAAPSLAPVAEPVAPAPVAVAAPAPVAAVEPARAGLPKVGAFALDTAPLQALANASGLEWVHSDPARVQQAQAAIAAEPKPIHVPREPKPLVALDDGPLVLVETRRDLRNLVLPFEQQPPAAH
jgi:ribonuclease E